MISVQTADFDVAAEYSALTSGDIDAGAVVMFVGRVREFSLSRQVTGLLVEHYPVMTEKALADILSDAKLRWDLQRCRIVHRIGRLALGDQIVLVGVSSAHREHAFAAAEFLMDYLKTIAPFWKKELTSAGDFWVEAQEKDEQAAKRW
jgi:molybdopterin synthase catalytic subunit